MAIENKRMRQLQATDAEWGQVNPVLLDGEIAFSSDIRKFKVGPGTWASLPYWDEVVTSFTALSDTPPSYAGAAGKLLFVNATETGVEFVTGTGQWVAKSGDTMTGPLIMDFPVTEEAAMIVEGGTAFALDSRRDGDMWWDMSNADGTLLHGRIGYKNNQQAIRLRSYGPGGDTDIANSLYVGRDDVWVTGTGLENPQANSVQTRERADARYMRNTSEWVDGQTYEIHQMAREGDWLGVALGQTTDHIKPQLTGVEDWISNLQGTLTLAGQTPQATPAWIVGNTYTWPDGGYTTAWRYRVPDISGTFEYEVWSVGGIGNQQPQLRQVVSPHVPSTTEWIEVPLGQEVWSPGQDVSILLVARSVSQPNSFTAEWQVENKNGNPDEGKAWFQSNNTQIRVHKTDSQDGNQTDNLEAVEEGGTLSFAGQSWTITSISVQSSHVRYNLTPNQGRPEENDRQLTFQWGSTDPIPYERHDDYWPPATRVADGLVSGWEGDSLDTLTATQHGYGVDLYVLEASSSPDWFIAAVTGSAGGGSGGDGVNRFTQLIDTPAGYAGYGGQVVRVQPNEEGLEYFDGQWVERTGDTMTGQLKMIIGDSETPAFEVSGGTAFVSRAFRDGDSWHDFWNAAGDVIYGRIGHDISNGGLRLRSYVPDLSGDIARTLYIGQEDVWITGTGTEVPDPNSVITAERGDLRYGGGASGADVGVLNSLDAALQRFNLTKQGNGSGNVVQDWCVDPYTGELFTLHVTGDPEKVVINIFESDGRRVQTSSHYNSAPSDQIGHQGITVCHDPAGARWFFCAANKGTNPDYNQKVARFQLSKGTGTEVDIGNPGIYTLLSASDAGDGSLTTACSTCGTYLVVENNFNDAPAVIYVFSLLELLEGGPGDYTGKELWSFVTPDIYVNADNPLQGIACDGQHIYIFAGDADLANKNTAEAFTMQGRRVWNVTDFQVGLAEALGDGAGTDFEMEGADWIWYGGQPQLAVSIASGDSGNRVNRIWALGAFKPVQSFGWGNRPAFMATGSNDFGVSDGEAFNLGRYEAKDDTWDQWLKIDGDDFVIAQHRVQHTSWDGIHTKYMPPLSGSGDQYADWGNDDGSLVWGRFGWDESDKAVRLRTYVGGDLGATGKSWRWYEDRALYDGPLVLQRGDTPTQYLEISGGDSAGAYIDLYGTSKILTFRNFTTGTDQIIRVQDETGTIAASFLRAGTANTSNHTVQTREKADARYLRLIGGSVNGTTQIKMPSDVWSSASGYNVGDKGYLYTSGSHTTTLSGNGYRGGGNLWVSLETNGNLGGGIISIYPQGRIDFSVSPNYPTGSSFAMPVMATMDYLGTTDLPQDNSVVTRARGDQRYMQASGGPMTGPLEIVVADSETPAIEVSGGTAFLARGFRDGDQWVDFWSANGDRVKGRMGWDEDPGAVRIRSYDDAAGENIANSLYVGRDDVWITGTGTENPDANSIQTRERADARYLQLTGGTINGNLTMTGTLTLNRTGGTFFNLNRTGDQYFDHKSEGGATRYARWGWFNGSKSWRARAEDAAGTTTVSYIEVRQDGDVRMDASNAFAPHDTSVISRLRGDNRFARKTTGTFSVTARDSTSPTGGNASATVGSGTFVRNGDMMFIEFTLANINTAGMTGGNNLYLHFEETSSTGRFSTAVVGRALLNNVLSYFTPAANALQVVPDIQSGYLVFREIISGGVNIIANVNQFASGTADIYVSGSYRI